MRGTLHSAAMAAGLLFTAFGAAPPSIAQAPLSNQQVAQLNAQANSLTRELLDIDLRLAALDKLLDGYDRGELLIFAWGDRVTMTEAEMREIAAQITISRPGAINPFTLDELDPDLQVNTYRGVSAEHAATLREEQRPLFRRRAEISSRLEEINRIVIADADRPGQAYDPNDTYETASCVLPHIWRNDVQGLGSSTWTIDEDGEASESGMGSTRGIASFSGNSLVIQWDSGSYAGNYTVQLGKDCNGQGMLQWTRAPGGAQSFPTTFTSLGGNKY